MRKRISVSLTEMPLCPRCGKPRDNVRHIYCEACLARKRETNNLLYRKRCDERLARGICPACGVRPALNGGRCQVCRAKANAIMQRRIKERKEQKLCLRCGIKFTGKGRFCDSCREKKNRECSEWLRKRYHERKAAGLCPKCGGPRDREGFICCSACIMKLSDRQAENRLKALRTENATVDGN